MLLSRDSRDEALMIIEGTWEVKYYCNDTFYGGIKKPAKHERKMIDILLEHIAKKQLRNVSEWGNQDCPHNDCPHEVVYKRHCSKCWETL